MENMILTDIVLAHRFSSPPGWIGSVIPVERRHQGIILVLSGRVEYKLNNGTRFIVEPGEVLYMPRGTVCSYQTYGEEAFVHMTVNFDALEDRNVFPKLFKRKLNMPQRFEQTMTYLVHTWTIRHNCYRERCMGLLYEMIYLLHSEMQSAPPQHMQKLLPARQYLDEHFAEDFALNILPEMCGMSENYFRRMFHAALRETPAEYRRRLRIAKACDLLLSGQFSMEEIASLCGYPDPAYFSRMFRKTMGMSPSHYRDAELCPREDKLVGSGILTPDRAAEP